MPSALRARRRRVRRNEIKLIIFPLDTDSIHSLLIAPSNRKRWLYWDFSVSEYHSSLLTGDWHSVYWDEMWNVNSAQHPPKDWTGFSDLAGQLSLSCVSTLTEVRLDWLNDGEFCSASSAGENPTRFLERELFIGISQDIRSLYPRTYIYHTFMAIASDDDNRSKPVL